jgi:hypothetical protein
VAVAGEIYVEKESFDRDVVFCDERGDYLKPDNKSARGCFIARRAKLGVAITVGSKNAKVD